MIINSLLNNRAIIDGEEVRSPTGMAGYLKSLEVDSLCIMGLATDYCVKLTALDITGFGFSTTLITDGCRDVNLNPNDYKDAVEEMREAGVKFTTSDLLVPTRKE